MRLSLLILTCLMLAVICSWAYAQDDAQPTLTTKLDLAYVTRYVWRGIPQTTGGAVQPSLTLSHSNGLSFNLWASQDSDAGEFREHDYTLSYAWNSGAKSMNAGLIYYAFPNTTLPSTSELYASVCFEGLLSPSLSINYDMDEANGFYLSLSAGHVCPLTESTGLNLSGRLSFSSAGYNKFWFNGVDKTAISDLYLSASVPFTLGGSGTLTPSISYSTMVNSDLSDALSGAGLKSDNFVGTLAYSLAF